MTATLLASRSRYARRQEISDAIADVGQSAWGRINLADITGTWLDQVPGLAVAFSGAQYAAATGSDDYVAAALGEQNIEVEPQAVVIPQSLAGRSADGRTLASLLDEPRIATLVALKAGAAPQRALAVGWVSLERLLRTEVADAGRVSDGLATTVRPRVGYVRMIQGKTCGRCAILAGKWFRSNQGFQRHPRCDCIHIPSRENVAGDLRTNPRTYFDSLAPEDQNQLFGKANAQAIRDGSDPIPVMNASMRNGGITTVGIGGRRVTVAKPTPSQIYETSRDRAQTLDLLRLHGYIR